MSFREIATHELADLMGVLAHHDRIQIVEELSKSEQRVQVLKEKLQISHSRVSQHLALLRTHKVVAERRQGRHVFYRLTRPELSLWLLDALKFITFRLQHTDQILTAVESAHNLWLNNGVEREEARDEKLILITGHTKNHQGRKKSAD